MFYIVFFNTCFFEEKFIYEYILLIPMQKKEEKDFIYKLYNSDSEYISVKLPRQFVKDYVREIERNKNLTYKPKTVTGAIIYGLKLVVHSVLGNAEFALHH